MADTVAPEYQRFVDEVRRPLRSRAPARPLADGQTGDGIQIASKPMSELLRVAARRAVGLYRPTRRTEVVWVDGDSELAVGLVDLKAKLADGVVTLVLPVRCDQTGPASVEVTFACGSPGAPAGLYAAALRRPRGPEIVVATWGDALVAFAWQCLLGLVSGIAGATGKDARGNVLVPVEMTATARGLQVVPMARHRFHGSSGLKTTAPRSTGPATGGRR